MVYLIDSSIFIFRYYFSLPDNWHSEDGYPTNAVYGFCSFLIKLLEQEQPRYLAAAFDESLESGFRHRLYPGYKANRVLPDEALAFQLNSCREAARILGIADFASSEYEADDLIGSLATVARTAGHAISILSRDKDLAQLLMSSDCLWDFGAAEPKFAHEFQQRFGVAVERLPDYLALVGDNIDNVPGVPGIGAKTAAAILQRFECLDTLFDNLDQLALLPVRGAGTLAGKIRAHRDQIELARQLTRIVCEVPLGVAFKGLRWRGVDLGRFEQFCEQLGLGKRLLRRVERL